MKIFKKTILTLLISLLTLISFAQKSSVLATVEDVNNLKIQTVSTTVKTDLQYRKAFPSSRQESLQNVYEFTCDCDVVDLYTSLHKVNGLKGIEYAPTYETLELPNDYTIAFSNNWALDLINAETAWSYTKGNPNLNVAISDQNYYNNHEELNGKINYYDNTNTSTKTHGTAVATIVAGNTNNSIGLASIGYNTTLNLYRMNYNDVLMASYAGAKVINLSWTSGCYYNIYAQQVIDEVYNNGTFIVASAGNGSTCGNPDALVYPAAYNHVFAVTSVGSLDNIERVIGNPTTRHQTNISVDICAPGYYVPLTIAPGLYTTGNGTSFAAPYVTGTVSLMLALKPDLTNDEIDSILRISAVNIDSLNPNYVGKIGSGRLNAGSTLSMVQNIINEDILDNEDDGNNGHGNEGDGNDSSNPGQGNNNGHWGKNNPWDNGNHYGLSESNILNNNTISTNKIVYDINGKEVNLKEAPVGFYFMIENNIIIKKIYKN